VIYLVLPLCLLLAAVAVATFVWAVRSGQMDDLETPALRPLLEEDELEEAGRDGLGDRSQEVKST